MSSTMEQDGEQGADAANTDETDVIPWRDTLQKFICGGGTDGPITLPTSLQSEDYNMKHPKRGICAIFNHKVFDNNLNLDERTGTDVDAESLNKTFSDLGFHVVLCENHSKEQIKRTLAALSKEDHEEHDCLVCCVLTHGGEGYIYARDKRITVGDFVTPFLGSDCRGLVGKPKIFLIQACRGDKMDKGTKVVTDSTDSASVCKLPSHSDILVCYSTIPGYLSWRNTDSGSWFVQALCKVLRERSHNTDLLSMMTVVNRYVAVCNESSSTKKKDCGMKQTPCVEHTLTRKIYFVSNMKEQVDDATGFAH